QNNTSFRASQHYADPNVLQLWTKVTGAAWSEANHIIAASQGIKDGLVFGYGTDAGKISVISNPVGTQEVANSTPVSRGSPFMLAAGRLHPQKGFDDLLRAYAAISSDVKEDLVILGEGEDRRKLEALAVQLGISDRVQLPGFRV